MWTSPQGKKQQQPAQSCPPYLNVLQIWIADQPPHLHKGVLGPREQLKKGEGQSARPIAERVPFESCGGREGLPSAILHLHILPFFEPFKLAGIMWYCGKELQRLLLLQVPEEAPLICSNAWQCRYRHRAATRVQQHHKEGSCPSSPLASVSGQLCLYTEALLPPHFGQPSSESRFSLTFPERGATSRA